MKRGNRKQNKKRKKNKRKGLEKADSVERRRASNVDRVFSCVA